MTLRLTALVCLLSALMTLPVSVPAQTSVVLSPTKDNTLFEDVNGALSNGAGQYMFVGKTAMNFKRRALVAFDVAGSVPAGATIDSVKLTLNFSRTIAGDVTVELHRVLANWGEGISNATGQEGAGTAATTGDATWIHTFFSTGFWATAGGDYSATVSASKTVGGSLQYGFHTWGSTAGMVADVQSWLDSPSTNFGWILVGNEATSPTAKRFSTREDPIVGNRPTLTVFYTEGGIPCSDITSFVGRCVGGGTKTLQFRVNLLNSTIWAGQSVTIDVDGTQYSSVIFSNGIHSRANFQISGVSVGSHTATLIDPPCGLMSHPNCAADTPNPEWDASDAAWKGPDGTARPELIGNYPNPFNPTTIISYELPEDAQVTLKVYSMLGQVVATLVDGFQSAGTRSVQWDGRNSAGADVAAGVYVYTLKAGSTVETRKMILVR